MKGPEEMTAEEFINQPMDYFIELWNEALEQCDLTIKETNNDQ